MRRVAKAVATVLGALLALVAIALFVLLDTQLGRREVGSFAVSKIQNAIDGKLTVPGVEAGLSGATFHDVTLTDQQGRPFLQAKEIHARYDVRSFLNRRIDLTSLELVDPVMVLSQPPGEDWNFKRIFGVGAAQQPSAPPGFGSWVRFRNVTFHNGEITVKQAWSPADSLSPQERRRQISDAIAGHTRWRVARAPGGYERVMHFRDVDGRLRTLRLADPEKEGIFADVARLSTVAEPLLPPAAHVRDLTGRFWFTNDTLRVQDGRLRLPGSRLTGNGIYALQEQDVRLVGRAEPLRLQDVQWVRPSLPEHGSASMHFALVRQAAETRLTATDLDASVESATAHGRVGIAFGDSLRFHDTDVRFSGVRTQLLERLLPGFSSPRQGALTGRLALRGQGVSLRVSGDIRFDDAADGVSHVTADGHLAFRGRSVVADGLRLELLPLQVALARAYDPSLPIAGTLTGTATANGATSGRLALQVDVTHHGAAGTSHIVGDIALAPTGGRRGVDADVAVGPLALATVGRFAPAAGLHGSATGRVRLRGTTADLRLNTDLEVSGGGALHAEGTLDLTGAPGYDIQSRMRMLNLAAIAAHVPATKLTGTASVRGSGTDPATMHATLAADLQGASVEGIGTDAAQLRVAIENGLASVDSSTIQLASGRLALNGRFGVAAGRSGTLSFDVDVDSLRDFSRWLPGDTGLVAPRPARMQAIIASARADSLRIARATEVERAATGRTTMAKLSYDTIPPLARDSVSGSLHAAGTLKGNVKRFDVAGQAQMHDLVIAGTAIGNGRTTFTWLGAPSPGGTIGVEAAMDSLRVAGFALDSVTARVRQTGLPGHGQPAAGTAIVAVRQDTRRDYSVNAEYRIELDRRQVKLNDVMMRFDSLTWHTTRPGAVIWGGSGFELQTIEMRNDQGGHIYLDGRFPKVGSADLRIALDSVQVGNVIALLQDSLQAQGLLSLHADVRGTQSAPQLSGDVHLADARWEGTDVPSTAATFDYAARSLTAKATMTRNGRRLATAGGTLPIDLAPTGGAPHLLDRPVRLDVSADSLPVDLASRFTSAVSDVSGYVYGTIAVRGTTQRPDVSGDLRVAASAVRIASTGMLLHDVRGSFDLHGDSLTIASLTATSGGKNVSVTGGIGLQTLTRPAFDLRLHAADAVVLNDDHGNLRADADLRVEGPYDAVHVTGDVLIRGGVFYLPEPRQSMVLAQNDKAVFAVLDTTIAAQRELLPQPSPLLENLRLDVNVRVERDTWVRNQDANVELYTPPDFGAVAVHVDRASNAFSATGVIDTERGYYTFLGRRFEMQNGTAQFVGTPGVDPVLQITAAHDVKLPGQQALQIRVVIGGTLQMPRISLESDAQPPIAQSDLLSYLAFGRASSSLLQEQGSALSGPGSSSGDLVGSVAALATQQLAGVAAGVFLGDVSHEATRQLGLDYFNITPADVPAELSSSSATSFLRATEIEGGKYLNSRTFLSVQMRGANATPGVRLQYKTLQGYGVDAAWQPRFLPLTPSLETQSAATTSVFGLFLFRDWTF